MKVGVLTFHNTTNYGALLQAYALQTVIKERYDCPCELIDYCCPLIEKRELPQKPTLSTNIKRTVASFLEYNGRIKKKKNMQPFESLLSRSVKYSREELAEAGKCYDKVFVGSDIVWEPGVTDGDMAYYLDFVPADKRYSYAASFGNADIPNGLKNKCGSLLSEYRGISVREKSGVSIVKNLSGREAKWVLDPTLLLEADKWDEMISFKPHIEKYILLYFLDSNGAVLETAKNLAAEQNYKIVLIHSNIRPVKGVINVCNCPVDEFLGWIRHSSVVMTASYHGLAFAANFGKEFYYFNRAHAERMISFAEMLDISDRELVSSEDFVRKNVNNKALQRRLQEERQKSLQYLDDCFNRAE